jgi:hypothetical protein
MRARHRFILSALVFTFGCGDKDDTALPAVDLDGDGYDHSEDCDDENGAVHPGAGERCNGLDDDCDGEVDEDAADAQLWYIDGDLDGYGDPDASSTSCDPPNGGVAVGGDCDDDDDGIHPDADELCNGVDDDCDGLIDDEGDPPADATTWYLDYDEDGYGGARLSAAACSQPSGYVADSSDCDDLDPTSYPGADELCDGADNDCDGATDEDDAVDGALFYADDDDDGYGDALDTTTACSAPSGYVSDATDCDDQDPSVSPGSPEACNGVDDDCDGAVDEDDASDVSTWYLDHDSDSFGDAAFERAACDQPTGYVADDSDCDDLDAAVLPCAAESCNGVDDDCDGTVDEDDAIDAGTFYADGDGDGYGDPSAPIRACALPSGAVRDASDCDDGDASSHPSADEHCDGHDDDCDGAVDEDDAVDATTWYADDDGDGWGDPADGRRACAAPSGWLATPGDCDDGDAAINPDAIEVCDPDDVDEDCNGVADDDDASAVGLSTWYADVDTDGYGDPGNSSAACERPRGYLSDDSDCDDGNRAVNPGAVERCNGVDDDCDALVDDADPDISDPRLFYSDVDGDGYGDRDDAGTLACSPPTGTTDDDSDCDDSDPDIHPGADEYCDGIDTDCDGELDDEDALDGATWYLDADLDGYGDAARTTTACSQPSGYVEDSSDCDDTDADINPLAEEACNGEDDDCDGLVDGDDPDTTAVPSGRISVDETWTAADSPYCFEGDVQISPSVTLTMEPGTEVGGLGHSLENYGNLVIAGDSSEMVEISSLNMSPGRSASALCVFDIAFAHITGGTVLPATGHSVTYQLTLTDSVLEGVGYFYLWYPSAACDIERNVFIRSGGFSTGMSGPDVTFSNNVFYEWTSSYAIENWANYGGNDCQVHHNSFIASGKIALQLPSGYSSSYMDATENYWGTTDTAVIDSMIWDQNDDLSCAAVIPYAPHLTAPHADTPDHTPWL